jgi:hypothetical protein
MDFLRENGLKLTERFLEEDRGSRPKLIRFVKGNSKYSIVFVNEEPTLHLFKEKLRSKKPYSSVAAVHGNHRGKLTKSGGPGFKRTKIVVDLNNRNSFKQILDFL